MSTEEREYQVAEKVVRSERRFRRAMYVLAVIFFLFCVVLALEVKIANDRLRAEIQKTLEEVKIQNDETRRFNTCLLLVPIQERSPEVQRNCFNEIDEPGGLDESQFETSPPTGTGDNGSAAQANALPNSSNDASDSSSLPNSTPQPQPAQLENSQAQEETEEEPQPSIVDRIQNVIRRVL